MRKLADHPFEPGPYGTCKRCGTGPISFKMENHPGHAFDPPGVDVFKQKRKRGEKD